MSYTDASGLPLTMSHPLAGAAWDATVHGVLRHGRETPDALARTLTLEPEFAAGWAVKGLSTLLLSRAELATVARDAHARACLALTRTGGTRRERALVTALGLWLEGRPTAASAVLGRSLDADPRCALTLKLDHALRFILGDRRGMERTVRGAIPHWDDAHPHLGYAEGCLAFALEENGSFAEAERQGRQGLDRAPDDAWGLHAVAHVLDMQARNTDGIAWLETQEARWAHCNNFGVHVWWHLGLFHLDRGAHDRVLALYDSRIRAEHTDDYRDIANGASMLVRLELERVDVGDRWEELAALSAGRVDDGCLIFADLHYLMALNGAGRDPEAARLCARIAADAHRPRHDMHEVAAVAGHPTAQGLAAFRAGRYQAAFDLLRGVRGDLQRAGGSHAQRDVFSRIMIESAIRAGRWAEAESELALRARRRGAEDGFTHRRLDAIAGARAACAAE